VSAPPNQVLSARDAASITRQLLEFEALNRKRELVNNLVDMGITSETFNQWLQLDRVKSLGVTQALAVDVTNMISHIEKGIDTREDALVRMSESQIRKFEKDAWDRQEVICSDHLKSVSPETETPNRKKP
jgi:hypothetical protein